MAEVKLGGTWLHSLGHVSSVKWSSAWGAGPCGPSQASCAVAVDPATDTGLFQLRQAATVNHQGVRVFGGRTIETDRAFPRQVSARGWAALAADFEAVDASGNPTTNPRTAVTQAIANGLPWTNPTAFDDVSLGVDGEPQQTMLDTLLNNYHVTVNKRWGVDAYGVAFVTTDPTTPTWYFDASDLPIGVADDGLFTRVRARYYSAVDVDGNPTTPLSVVANDAAAQAVFGVLEYPMDLTRLGMLSAATATAYAQQQLALLTVPQWLARVVTNSTRLLTPGGLGADLSSVRAGQMVRLFNVPNALGGLRNELGLDVVLGEVEYDTESPAEVTIAPVSLAVRNLADTVTQVATVAKAAGVVNAGGSRGPFGFQGGAWGPWAR